MRVYNNLYTCVHGVLFEPTRHLFCLLLCFFLFFIIVVMVNIINTTHTHAKWYRYTYFNVKVGTRSFPKSKPNNLYAQ